MLGREPPDLSPIITKIMNAVFCEEEVIWEPREKLAKCSIKIYNYTARARAYTIIAKWPESDSTSIVQNERGGGKKLEACGHGGWMH